MTALETLQALHQANPVNADVNKAYLSMLTNPVMNGSLTNVLGNQSSVGSSQQPQAPMLPSDPNMMTAQEKAMAAQSQGGGQPTTQDGGYDSSFINNIPGIGGILNALGRVSAGGASGISSLLANGGALATGNTDNLSNPLTDALQGLSDPNKAKYLGTQLADKGLMDQNNGLKGALDFGSSLVLDPSLYLGGMGILGKAGEAANAGVKGLTGLDALGLVKNGASKASDLISNLGKDANVASDSLLPSFQKGAKDLYDAGGMSTKDSVANTINGYNQLDNYGFNLKDNGVNMGQQMPAVRAAVANGVKDSLNGLDASIPKADLMGGVKDAMKQSGLVDPAGNFVDPSIQKVYDRLENVTTNFQKGGINNAGVGDAYKFSQELGDTSNNLLKSPNATDAEKTFGIALKDAQANLITNIRQISTPLLPGGKIFTPEQVVNIAKETGLNADQHANLINDLQNMNDIGSANNIMHTTYFGEDAAKRAFRATRGDENGVQIPLNKYDALQLLGKSAINSADGIKSVVKSGAQALGKGITNAKAAMAQSASGKAAQSGIGKWIGQNKGFVGGALDRGLSGSDFAQQTPTTDTSSQNDPLNQNITDLLNNNKANNSSIMNRLIMSGMAAPEAAQIANNQAPLLTTDQNKGLLAIKNSLSTLDQLKSAYDGTKSMKGPGTGDISNLLGSLGIDQNAKVYNNIASGLLATLKAAAGETGVLSDADTARIAGLVPNLNDTPDNAQKKIDQIKQLLTAKAQNTVQLIGR